LILSAADIRLVMALLVDTLAEFEREETAGSLQ
jgi:hypothetical protein